MSDPEEPPVYTGRVRVTNPLTSAPAHVRRSVHQEIDESTAIGEIYMRSLIRSQLRAALTVTLTLVLSIGALPLVFLSFDAVTEFHVLGVPAPWLILGVAVYPGLFLLGWVYIRQAERAERDFTALVEPDGP
ncbi:hypothetical protein [Aeromicrobium sp. UC242_57]|uniref:hypothetical protein n=1 Tax=Aeromicrobium sp. UC242_57 TaxID=3374624 RepID=UPI00379CA5C5